MRFLAIGSTGPSVQLLQLALNRAGFGILKTDGIFGPATKQALIHFQSANGLEADGAAGSLTQRQLLPWYTGFTLHKLRPGDSFYSLAGFYGSSPEAIAAANPESDPLNLQPGESLTVPLPFDLVPTGIDWSSVLLNFCVRGLAARYPFVGTGEIGKSVMGKPLWYLSLGRGENRLVYAAAFHANEWITTPLLLKFCEELCKAYLNAGMISGRRAGEILEHSTIYIVPCLDPDGMDLVTKELQAGEFYNLAKDIADDYPQFPFPEGWKANIRGTDLNLQFPAGWEQAKINKAALGISSPAPADFVGTAPLSAPESRAIHDFTRAADPALILAFHTQGRVIYWRYLDYEPAGSRQIAELFSTPFVPRAYTVSNNILHACFALSLF